MKEAEKQIINYSNPEFNDISSLDFLDREDLLEMVKKMVSGGISLSFLGKRYASEIEKKVKPRQVRILKNFCIGSEEQQSKNYLVEGENLQTLVTLYKYRGQVDVILTDPPYNTGNDFRYNDKWDTDPNDPELGLIVAKEDGAKHTKWMKAMLPRLKMMKAMLKPSGVIAICIDHRELFRLGMLMNEVFGENNRLGIINWQKKYAPTNDSTHTSSSTEYVLVYARDEEIAKTFLLDRTEKMNSKYSNTDKDPGGDWRISDATVKTYSVNSDFGIQSPFTGEVHYPGRGSWSNKRQDLKGWIEEYGSEYVLLKDSTRKQPALVLKGTTQQKDKGFFTPPEILKEAKEKAEKVKEGVLPLLLFGKDGKGIPSIKRHLKKVKQGKVPMTFWADEDYETPFELGAESWEYEESGHSQMGINELDSIVGKGHNFTTVKPLKLFKKILQLWCPPTGLVLDPYAGSGTTGHAVLEINNEVEGSDRRFILIEQGSPERGDKYARSLTFQRLKNAIEGNRFDKHNKPTKADPLEGGFKYLALTQKIDAKTVLSMKKEELIDIVIISHWDEVKRKANLIRVENPAYKYLVGKNEAGNGYFIIWNGGDAVESFNEKAYETVVQEARKEKLIAPYYVYARHEFYQTNTVIFHKIPDKILAHLGLNESSDSYNQGDEE